MIIKYERVLSLPNLLGLKSFFLFGPRSTGKSFLIREQLPRARVYDLLDNDVFGRLMRRPALLGEEASRSPIVIDEIQKLPALLDEVQRLIDSRGLRFLLTGSSVRKLKRGGANLLGGRAWQASLFPLRFSEIPDFDLIRYLNRGGLPHIYQSLNFSEELNGYVNLYLREEIAAEALVRRVEPFARFLDVMALQNGEELYYQGLASDCGLPAKTIQHYVQMVEDTLLGFSVPSFLATQKRKAIVRPKFYLFDVGVTNALAHRGEIKPQSELFGRCFEHFLILELRAHLGYQRLNLPMQYWRSTSGFEVDCVIGDQLAVEFKASDCVSERHLRGLRALREEGLVRDYALVSLDPVLRHLDGITIYPWREFLRALNAGEVLRP